MGQEKREIQNNQKTRDKMAVLRPHILKITLNLNGFNFPIKRHRVGRWIKKQDPTIRCLKETRLSSKDKYRLRVKGWKMILKANGKEKKASVAILKSDKVGFKIKKAMRDKEGQYIMVKGILHQEDVTLINICAPNTGAPIYIKQLLTDLKEEINSNTIIVGDLNTPLTSVDRSSKQKVNKEMVELNKKLDQKDLCISRILCLKTAECTFFSGAHGTFSKIDHMLGNKASLHKFKKIEIISGILFQP
uniref:exodeoxyribonuclease III n=1 Tax=Equus caballus TaxID=9796 RepID=A0A9L0S8H9_HORSE